MRPADSHHAVVESLQADVMRFMAIIAFCLIAILALVRSVAPADEAEGAVAERTAKRQEPAQNRAPAAVEPVAEVRSRQPAPPVQRTVTVAEPPPAAPVEATSAEAAPAAAPPAPPAEDTPAASASESEGLSLRFASEGDFLRLVNRGRIQVYAFDGARVLRLGQGLEFAPATAPPGQVHELLPETIPALMRSALERSAPPAAVAAGAAGSRDGFRWGIAMPARMAAQVRDFVDRGATGELIIDRFGEVRLHGGV